MRNIADVLLGGIWSASTIGLVVDGLSPERGFLLWVQIVMSVAGVVYFLFVKFPNDIRMNKMNREHKRLENEVLRREIEDYEEL